MIFTITNSEITCPRQLTLWVSMPCMPDVTPKSFVVAVGPRTDKWYTTVHFVFKLSQSSEAV